MAFTSSADRTFKDISPNVTSGDIGPGHYHNEGKIHKLAMDSIYPKKKAPFNSNTERFDSKLGKKGSPGKLLIFNNNETFDNFILTLTVIL